MAQIRSTTSSRRLVSALLAAVLAGCQGSGSGDDLASAKSAIQAKDQGTAQIHLKNVLAKQPGNVEARTLLGKSLLEAGDAKGAVIELRRALELKADENEVIPLLAAALFQAGEVRLLVQQFGSARLKLPEAQSTLIAYVAMSYLVQNQFDKARQVAEQGLQEFPKSPGVRLALARVRMAEEKPDEALRLADAIVADSANFDEGWAVKGLLHERAGDRDKALAAFAKALEANPKQLDSLYAMVLLKLSGDDPAAAKEAYKKLAAAWPRSPNTLYLEARINYREGKYAVARPQYAALLNLAPENVPTLIAAGMNELKLNAPIQAEAMLARAVSLAPQEPYARLLLAQAQLRLGRPEKATAALTPLLEQKDVSAGALTAAAQARLLQGDAPGADALFGRAEKLKSSDPQIRTALAVARIARGVDADAALRELQQISESTEDTDADFRVISAQLARKDTKEALVAIARLEKKGPLNPAVRHLRGQALAISGDAAGARAAFEDTLKLEKTYAPALAELTSLDLADGKADQARQRLLAAMGPDRDNSTLLTMLATLSVKTGAKSSEVLELLDRATKADPQNLNAWMTLLTRHYYAADYSAAMAAAQTATKAIPDNVQLMDLTGRVQLAAGNINQANSTYADLIKVAPRSAAGYLGLMATLLAANDTANAAKTAQRLVALDPSNVVAQRMAGDIEVRRRNFGEAQTIARRLQRQAPEDAAGFLLEAQVASGQGNRAATIAALRVSVRKLNPQNAPVLLHTELLRSGDKAQAKAFADSWRAYYPKDALFVTYLGDVESEAKNWEGASALYDKALEVDPKLVPALNNAALALLQRNDPRALDLASRAVAIQPNNPDALDTLAQAHMARKAYPQAIQALQQAISRATNSGPLQLSLARAYETSGDRSSAMAELQSVLDKGRSHPQFAEARKQLAALRQR